MPLKVFACLRQKEITDFKLTLNLQTALLSLVVQSHEGRDEFQWPDKNYNVRESTTNSDFNLKQHTKKKTSQTGHGLLVNAKYIGKPPGKTTKQRKKTIKWLLY